MTPLQNTKQRYGAVAVALLAFGLRGTDWQSMLGGFLFDANQPKTTSSAPEIFKLTSMISL